MLQWTCRLRDALEARGWLADASVSKQLTSMREAEFVGSSGSFPGDFRLEALQKCCYSRINQGLYLKDPETNSRPNLVPAIDTKNRSARYIRRLCGQPAIDFKDVLFSILWLSPTVFICTDCFYFGDDPVPEYNVSLLPRQLNDLHSFDDVRWGIGWYAYSFSSFGGTEPYQRLTLPMEFLGHVAARQLTDFSEIGFSRTRTTHGSGTSPERFPIDYALQFLSTFFPQDASIATDCWTVCELDASFLNEDALPLILSHRVHPLAKLSFGDYPISITLSEVLSLLLQESTLRAVQLPKRMIHFEAQTWAETYLHDMKFPLHNIDNPNDGRPLRFRETVFKSPHISICFDSQGFEMSFEILHAIVACMAISDLTLSFSRGFWRNDVNLPRAFGSYFLPLLRADSLLERLSIEFPYEDGLGQICRWMSDLFSSCPSRNLIFFNVSVWAQRLPTISPKQTQNLNRTRQWDIVLYPQLVLNYCRNHLPNKMRDGELPLMVKAVNEDIIYRKTANHIPFDTSTANAGLIFRTIKALATATLHRQHCAKRTPCTLAGTKRAASP
jgi:hypothetical protein